VIARQSRRYRIVGDVAQLYDELAPRLSCIVRRDVHASAPVIEDACQTAWCQLASHAQGIDRRGALSWLAKTAVREAVRLARRDQRELSLDERADDDGELNIPSPAHEPYQQVEWRERVATVRRLRIRQQRLLRSESGYERSRVALHGGASCGFDRGRHWTCSHATPASPIAKSPKPVDNHPRDSLGISVREADDGGRWQRASGGASVAPGSEATP
jgi:DNA-directed RNA polymerase specialized sigma24 family protein